MTRADSRFRRQSQQVVADRVNNRVEIRVGPTGRPRTAGKQRVTREQLRGLRHVQAARARGVTRSVNNDNLRACNLQALTMREILVRQIRPGLLPQHLVARVDEQGSVELLL